MPILLYCVSERAAPSADPLIAVAGLPVIRTEYGELVAFISSAPDSTIWLQLPLRTAGPEFHRVCNEILKSAAVIPFTFPTIFQTSHELEKHMSEQSAEYNSILTKFRDFVQMELRITAANIGTLADSGTDYLRRRQQSIGAAKRFSDDIQQTRVVVATEWRRHPLKDGFRVFALVNRNAIGKFEDSMRARPVPEQINVRVSGPWPVTEFIE